MKRFVSLGLTALLIACGGSTTPTRPTTATTTQPAGPVNLVGTYNLTVAASSVCTSLPSFSQSRTPGLWR
jgi:hypothetical protein